MLGVRNGDTGHDRRKNCHAKCRQRRTKNEVRDEPHQSDEQLHDRVLNGDPVATAATLSAQHDPAEDRDVLDRGYLVPALRTARPGLDDGKTFRPSPDANIQKRAKTRADDKSVCAEQKTDHHRSW
jgi:hypothetical protein